MSDEDRAIEDRAVRARRSPLPTGKIAANVISTGIDLIEIERIEHAMERWGERFFRRVYTPAEIAYCRGKPRRFAGRFAAKEATAKALGVGIRAMSWRDVEILPDPRGKPTIFLYGKAAELASSQQFIGFEVSITHSRRDAAAVVVAWKDIQ